MPADPQAIYQWLKALGTLTAAAMSEEVADNKLHAYAPLLAFEFDQSCFCPSSLAYVARGSKFFPTFGEVCALLTQWCREQRQAAGPAIAAPTDPWGSKVRAEREAAIREWTDPGHIQAAVKALEDSPLRPTLGSFLARAVEFHAPHLIELVPAKFRTVTPEASARVIPFPFPGAGAA
jgi:hypothetical protein